MEKPNRNWASKREKKAQRLEKNQQLAQWQVCRN